MDFFFTYLVISTIILNNNDKILCVGKITDTSTNNIKKYVTVDADVTELLSDSFFPLISDVIYKRLTQRKKNNL